MNGLARQTRFWKSNVWVCLHWPFSGWDGGDIGHTFLISACKQEKPCK